MTGAWPKGGLAVRPARCEPSFLAEDKWIVLSDAGDDYEKPF